MLTTQRVFHASTDISAKVNDFRSGAHVFAYTAGQYLYVASEMPFNHLHVQLTAAAANAAPADVAVDLWWNRAWTPAVDIVDETRVGAASLGQSGRITWACHIEKGWTRELKSSDVTGLEGTHVYDMHWARLSWSDTLTGSTSLDYIGQKFANDTDLFGYYPALNNAQLMTRFRAGKTDWNEQHFMAADAIARDLVGRRLAFSRSQIFDCGRMLVPAVHKAAQLIYAGCGAAFAADHAAATKAYDASMNSDAFRIASSEHLTARDKVHSTAWGRR